MSDTSWTALDEALARCTTIRARMAELRAAGDTSGDEWDQLHDDLWDAQMDVEGLRS